MNAFKRAATLASAAVDSVYGEPVRFEPRRSGGRMTAGVADPSRPIREPVTATVTAPPSIVVRKGEGAENGDNARVIARRFTVGFDAATAAALGAVAGDHVVRLDEPGLPVLRLGEPMSHAGRAIFPAEMVG